MIDQAKAIHEKPPKNARWLYDGMAIIRQLKPKATLRQFFESFLKALHPNPQYSPLGIEVVNDVYYETSTKNLIRAKRGEKSTRTHIQSFDQKMLQGKEWLAFFNNIENKTDLLKWVVNYFCLPEVREQLSIPITTNDRFSTIKIEKDLITDVYTCNHEEADTRLLVHALEEETDIVVVSKDTDVFVLLVYAYCKMESTKKWYMKIDHRFVCIGTIVNYFGNSICSRLPHIHAITGCDTTSFFH